MERKMAWRSAALLFFLKSSLSDGFILVTRLKRKHFQEIAEAIVNSRKYLTLILNMR